METSINHAFSRIPYPVSIKKSDIVEVKGHGQTLIIQGHDISHLEGSGNYTFVHTLQGKKYIVCKTLKTLQATLSDNFVRVHKSYIVNLAYVISRVQPFFLLLNSGKKVPVARRRTHQILLPSESDYQYVG